MYAFYLANQEFNSQLAKQPKTSHPMIPRHAEKTLRELARGYPVIGVTGPRQSGKSTLVRHVFADKPYISLEDPDDRERAQDDPRGFLAAYPDGGPSLARAC